MSAKEMSKADIVFKLAHQVYRMADLLKAVPPQGKVDVATVNVETLLDAMDSLINELEFTANTAEGMVGTDIKADEEDGGLAPIGFTEVTVHGGHNIRLCDAVQAMALGMRGPVALQPSKNKHIAGVQ